MSDGPVIPERPTHPVCGADTTPLDPRTWRPARVWARSSCRRRVKNPGDRCYQHPRRP